MNIAFKAIASKTTASKIIGLSALTLALMAGAGQASAKDCFILVHGHGIDGTNKLNAVNYWQSVNSNIEAITGRVTGDFYKDLTGQSFAEAGNGAHFGITGYYGKDNVQDAAGNIISPGYPYWHPATAGSVANQIIAISNGQGDGVDHPRQCEAADTFWVVSHSQGAQVMTYISGNASTDSLFANTTFDASNTQAISNKNGVKTCDGWLSGFITCYYNEDTAGNVNNAFDQTSQQSFQFGLAMTKIAGTFTLSGAINGTEGADRTCDGSLGDTVLNYMFFGNRRCEDVVSLQTHIQYNPRTYTGEYLAGGMYNIGGYKGYPHPMSATSSKLNGEDDGYINLASQMNCSGSGKRKLYDTLKYGSYTCDNTHKRHTGSFNLALLYGDHDSMRNSAFATVTHKATTAGTLSCSGDVSAARTISDCLGVNH